MIFRIEKIDWLLYVIIDQEWVKDRSIEEIAEAVIQGGANIIQYRDKKSGTKLFYNMAVKLRQWTSVHSVPLIINDRLDIALAVKADGIHLGQDDLPINKAREIVGKRMFIGASASSLKEFENAKDADYFGIGAIYPTKTKMDAEMGGIELIREIRALTDKPLIGIGGITLQNLTPVIRAGCDGVAVISAVMGSNDIEKTTNELVKKVKEIKSRICLDGLSSGNCDSFF